jgi:hypothetical protein
MAAATTRGATGVSNNARRIHRIGVRHPDCRRRQRLRVLRVELLVTDDRLMFACADVLSVVLGTWSRELGGRAIDLQVPAPSAERPAMCFVMLHLNPHPTHISRATLGITSSCFSPSQASATSSTHCQPSRTTMSRCVRSHRTAHLELEAAPPFPLPLRALLSSAPLWKQRSDFSEPARPGLLRPAPTPSHG